MVRYFVHSFIPWRKGMIASPSRRNPPTRPPTGAATTKTRSSFDRQLLEWNFLTAWEEETAPAAKVVAANDGEAEEGEGEEEEEEGEITPEEGAGGKGKGKAEEKVEAAAERWTPVPDTFESAAQYVDVWFPLLLQEMRAETLSEVTTEGVGAFCKVRAWVRGWVGWSDGWLGEAVLAPMQAGLRECDVCG